MDSRRCAACRRRFRRCPQVPAQRYCSDLECQRERRRLSQRELRKHDPDYKDNQSRAQRNWRKKNPDYWREYRKAHPEYLERNRHLQRERNRRNRVEEIAKMDVLPPTSLPASGVYRLTPLEGPLVAKMGAWVVEITLVSPIQEVSDTIAKRERDGPGR